MPSMIPRRLFTAVLLPHGIREILAQMAQDIRLSGGAGRFVPPQNYHLTLHFLGDTHREDDVINAMGQVQVPPLCLELAEPDLFRRKSGDILIIRLKTSPPLGRMQREMAEAFREAGFPLERRAYTPHLTLARDFRGSQSLWDRKPDVAHRFEADGVSLMESRFENRGVMYEERFFISCGEEA